jgi:hypothetical protein
MLAGAHVLFNYIYVSFFHNPGLEISRMDVTLDIAYY